MAMTLRLNERQDRLLRELAAAQNISKQEAAARAIVETAERHLHQERLAELSEQTRTRYADLLRRLGE
ncbi:MULTISPECIES: CopG family transcriptional regulator [Actinomyces]|nr:CopG family transcriptional regulator [Actinomyces succiniciruminis]RAX23109.1 CopG family transcriptional regulator [Actinomyces sp. Z5]RAX24020.1 CopG family transcriptional regulator [Actinomyces sp. Z3]